MREEDALLLLMAQDEELAKRLLAVPHDVEAWREAERHLRQAHSSYGGKGKPPTPTDAPAGSAEKRKVMRERMAQGYDACHPLDAPADAQEYEIDTNMNGSIKRLGIKRK